MKTVYKSYGAWRRGLAKKLSEFRTIPKGFYVDFEDQMDYTNRHRLGSGIFQVRTQGLFNGFRIEAHDFSSLNTLRRLQILKKGCTMMANRVKVLIYNSEYSIISNEDPEYVRSLAFRLDDNVKDLMQSDSHMSLTKALVLCGLSYQDDFNKADQGMDNLRVQVKEYLEDAADARSEAEELKREIAILKKENQELKSQLLEQGMPEGYKKSKL